MFLLIDNYDSFTYNLHHYGLELGMDIRVVRNDKISIDEIRTLSPEGIILSPGPCTPNEAGICLDVVKTFAPSMPILGVCLGHQAIGQAFGGKVIRAPYVMHGKTSMIHHVGDPLFQGLKDRFEVTRYHSLIIDANSFPDDLEITARTDDDIIMALRHRRYPCYGVQFHPESIASEHGHDLMRNFFDLARRDLAA